MDGDDLNKSHVRYKSTISDLHDKQGAVLFPCVFKWDKKMQYTH